MEKAAKRAVFCQYTGIRKVDSAFLRACIAKLSVPNATHAGIV